MLLQECLLPAPMVPIPLVQHEVATNVHPATNVPAQLSQRWNVAYAVPTNLNTHAITATIVKQDICVKVILESLALSTSTLMRTKVRLIHGVIVFTLTLDTT